MSLISSQFVVEVKFKTEVSLCVPINVLNTQDKGINLLTY